MHPTFEVKLASFQNAILFFHPHLSLSLSSLLLNTLNPFNDVKIERMVAKQQMPPLTISTKQKYLKKISIRY